MKDPAEYSVRAVERALQILCCFDDNNPERGVTDIAQVVDLHKATTYRIVTTMVNMGFLERAADGQKYRLGMRLTDLGFQVIRRMDLRREALQPMTMLTERLDEACDLSVFNHGEVFYVELIQSRHALIIAARVGQRLPAYCTASGKIFLADLPASDLDEYLRVSMHAYTPRTITMASELHRHLALVREQDYALDDEEYEAGVRAVAAPIRGQDGRVVAAISVPGPASRIDLERSKEIAGALKETAYIISRRIGWAPGH